jgi:hypothetical protein
LQFAAKLAATVVAGTALGLAATAASTTWFMPGGVYDGPWNTNLSTGSAASDPYTRASVAFHGLLALNRSETLYYSATRDSNGNALTGDCRYAITGRDPDTRWWSITAYGPDDFLISNPADGLLNLDRYSVAKTTAMREPDGSFRAVVGAQPQAGNWIYAGHGKFSLTLRLYNPAAAVAADPTGATLPSIKRLGCP